MKHFTQADIDRRRAVADFIGCIYADRDELLYAPLDWQKWGLQQTASGYGAKLTSPYKINFEGRLYRLYTTCYSNTGTTWFKVKGQRIVVS